MKKIILKWSDSYIKTLQETRLLTQISSFSIVVMLVIMLVEFIYKITQASEISSELQISIVKSIFLDVFVILLFGSRFLLLFSKRKIFFYISQFIWLISFVTLRSQIASPEFGGCTKNVFPMFGETLSYIFVTYLIFTPLRQFITLLISIIRIFIK